MLRRTHMINISVIYGVVAVISLLLAISYCVFIHKKEMWLVWLYFSVFIANLGYFTLSISKTLEEALLANRIAYLGCVFLPLFMLVVIGKVCNAPLTKRATILCTVISGVIFLIAASPGYTDWYYKEVTFTIVEGGAKLQKVYGPLHNLYYVYLFAYFAAMIGLMAYAMSKKKIASYKHGALLAVVVMLNILIWLVEQMVNWDFEFLSVSYIASELLLLLLYGMIQDYELAVKERQSEEIIDNVTERSVTSQYSDDGSVKDEELDITEPLFDADELDKLSDREKEVLYKLYSGKKRKTIAEELYISENTVKKHISSIFSKLQVSSREELFSKLKIK
ncbi:MAG: hypothetical protein E7263_06750 [Lachnospiraceae bacterium]|nr:hypothetical protein [Lachnospiraceae bacterium]